MVFLPWPVRTNVRRSDSEADAKALADVREGRVRRLGDADLAAYD